VGNVVVYTAIYGAQDELKVQPPMPEVDYVCFTDQDFTTPGWKVVRVRPSPLPDRLAAKSQRMLPHKWVRGWPTSIWIDGSVQILSPSFASTALTAMHDGIAFFRHPDRDCIYQEAEVSKQMPKYEPSHIDAQIGRYRDQGYPEHAGLWASGIIAREHHRPAVRRLDRRWLKRCQTESVQDQISLPPLLRSLGMAPGAIPGNLWDNELIHVEDHLRNT